MIDAVIEKAKERLKGHAKRFKHTEGVAQTAYALAVCHDVDPIKAMMAGYYHDVAKYDSIEDQTRFLDPIWVETYQAYPVLYHAFAAACYLQLDFQVSDPEILDAIRYHVWGRPQMSVLEKIIFVSDSCEPNRGFDECPSIFELAKIDLDQAVEICMKISIDVLIQKNKKPSQEQLEAYLYYKEENRAKNKHHH